ncbi:MAG: NimC/NimA family protein [Clostridium butyricum]|nr:NimC/NimA family protein [Clostridium butyricum]
MKEVLEFLKQCGTFFIATNEGNQPHVRPFGAVCEYEGKLYIVTNNKKKVYDQMIKNPKIEICAMNKDKWMRIQGEVQLDERREARIAMMEDNKSLENMYNVDDNLMVVLKFKSGLATLYSFTEAPVTYEI